METSGYPTEFFGISSAPSDAHPSPQDSMESSWKFPHGIIQRKSSPDQGSDFQGSDFQGSPGKDGFSWHWKIQSRSKSTGNCFHEQQGAGSASSQNPKSRSSRKRAQLPWNSSSRIPTEFLTHNSHGIPHPQFPPKFLTHSSHQTPFQDFPSRRLLAWVFWEFHDRQGEGNFGNCRKTRMGEEGPSLCSAP